MGLKAYRNFYRKRKHTTRIKTEAGQIGQLLFSFIEELFGDFPRVITLLLMHFGANYSVRGLSQSCY